MFDSKEYKERQKEFIKGLKYTYGDSFDKYIIKYIEWKMELVTKGYQAISVDTEPTESKARLASINGKVEVLKDVLRRLS